MFQKKYINKVGEFGIFIVIHDFIADVVVISSTVPVYLLLWMACKTREKGEYVNENWNHALKLQLIFPFSSEGRYC